jgi:Ca2+-binding RTX toxin-like protein
LETLGNAAVMTLQPFTSIDGAGGTNTLNAILNGSVTPLALTNIQLVNATTSATATLGLVNASSLTRVANIASSAALTVSGIAAGADLASVNTASASVFQYATTTGAAESADLLLQNSTGAITIAGIETINITSVGTSANSTELTAANATTINIDPTSAGSQALTLTRASTNVTTLIDATAFNANLTATLGVAGTLIGGLGNDTLTGAADVAAVISGGDGNDSIVAGAAGTAHSDSMSGGAGNDTFTFAAGFIAGNATAALNDSVDGGAGVNTLVLTAANAEGVVNASTTIDNIQALSLSTAGQSAATLQADKIDSSIATVTLVAGTAAAYTVNFNAGASTLNLADAAAGNLSVAETGGTGTTDSLIISNTQTTGTDDSFGGTLSSAGFESLTIVTGAVATATQAITTLTLNGETAASTPTTLTVSGANTLDISTILTTSNTGLTTVNASGLTGTAYLDIDEVAAGTNGTFSITGSGGNDLLGSSGGTLGNFATTITAGAGNDVIYTGNKTDSVQGGLGNDLIVGGGGNDVLKGNEGNDTITGSSAADFIDGGEGNDTIIVGSSLTVASTVDGGAGVNTLSISAAVSSPSVGARISNIQTLNLADNVIEQDLSMFTATTLTRIDSLVGDNDVAIINAAPTLAELRSTDNSDSTGLVFSFLTDTTSNALTYGAATDAASTVAVLAVNDVETLTIGQGALTELATVELTSLVAADLTTLIVNYGNFVGTLADQSGSTAADYFTSLNAAANTGTVNFSITDQDITGASLTGSATAANSLTGGGGSDTITGGAAVDSLTGGAGNDVIVGGGGGDALLGGSGNDTITGGALVDTITGGTGADVMTGGTGNDSFLYASTADTGLASTGLSFTTTALLDVLTVNAGDTITLAVDTATDYDDLMSLQSTGAISGSVTANYVQRVVGDYDANLGTFTVGTVNADSVMLQWAVTSAGTTATQSVILVGVTDVTALLNGVITV